MNKKLMLASVKVAVFFIAMVLAWVIYFAFENSSLRLSPSDIDAVDSPSALIGQHNHISSEFVATNVDASQQKVLPLLDAKQSSAAIAQFSDQLKIYSEGELDHEDRLQAEQTLRKLTTTDVGRDYVVDTFFSNDYPEQSASIYNLMLSADLKDVSLIESLIVRDASESTADFKTQILDLIADASTQEQLAFSTEIDNYLAQLAQYPDPTLRDAAIARRAWYLAQSSQAASAELGDYLLTGGRESRREIYELIDSHAYDREVVNAYELSLTLQSLLDADYLNVPKQEQEQVVALMQKLHAAQE